MTPTTAPPRETDSTAERLEQEIADRVDDVRHPVDRIHRALETIREQVDELCSAGAALRRLEAEAALLADAHGVDLDLPDVDVEAAISGVEDDLQQVGRLRVAGDTPEERRTRSARNQVQVLRQAVREGDVEAVESRIEQLRRLLNDPAWLTDELVAVAFLEPTRERHREGLERQLVRTALRTARSFGRGHAVRLRNEVGEPVRHPERVTALLEEQIAAPRDFRSLFLDEIDQATADLTTGRDFESELHGAVAKLSDEELTEAVA